MENMIPQPTSLKPKIVKIVANILITVIGLSTGAAIVHGMVLQQCEVKKDTFIAGVLPPDVEVQKEQEATGEPVDLQKCVNTQTEQPFEAGVQPDEEGASLAGEPQPIQPSAQGATQVPHVEQPAKTVPQTAAPAPQSQAGPQMNIIDLNPTQRIQKPAPSTAPAPKAPKKSTSTSKSSKTISVDLDKLSMAVAMTETHNCQDDVGSALYNNCHGFRKNGKFMHFSTPAQSHAYFKQLWANSYGGVFPTYRLAQIYSGNDRPTSWLKNVTYYYNNL